MTEEEYIEAINNDPILAMIYCCLLSRVCKEEGDDDARLVEHGNTDAADGLAVDDQHS